jgi:hypothetical protein
MLNLNQVMQPDLFSTTCGVRILSLDHLSATRQPIGEGNPFERHEVGYGDWPYSNWFWSQSSGASTLLSQSNVTKTINVRELGTAAKINRRPKTAVRKLPITPVGVTVLLRGASPSGSGTKPRSRKRKPLLRSARSGQSAPPEPPDGSGGSGGGSSDWHEPTGPYWLVVFAVLLYFFLMYFFFYSLFK